MRDLITIILFLLFITTGVAFADPISVQGVQTVNLPVSIDPIQSGTQNDAGIWPNEFFNAKITDYIIAFFTFFIAWFTWGLKSATLKLWGATDTLVLSADNTAERQLRAYVLVITARVMNFGVGKIPSVRISIKNCGQTPASHFTQWGRTGFDTVPPSLSPPPFGNDKQMSTNVLAPELEIETTIPFNRVLQEHEVAGILKGEVALYVIGQGVYKDSFGKERITNYKMFSNGLTDIEHGGMSACEDGNEYT